MSVKGVKKPHPDQHSYTDLTPQCRYSYIEK